MTGHHKERAHSKFSASGSERWLNCPASVELEEASPPSPENHWSKEGTLAHEVLEALLLNKPLPESFDVTNEMVGHCERVVQKVKAIKNSFGGVMLVEKRIYNLAIDEEMFGTCDVIILGRDRTLHIIDFKYGQGHVVDPTENTQLIQYGLGAADACFWGESFDRVKFWIMQPRVGKNWHKSWVLPIEKLEGYWQDLWHKGVARVRRGGHKPMPGSWCHWCRAKLTCPAKNEKRVTQMTDMFLNNPLPNEE